MKNEPQTIMIAPGMFEERVVRGVKTIKPSRFENGYEDDDLEGWIWYEGKRQRVQTAYWGDALVWEFADYGN